MTMDGEQLEIQNNGMDSNIESQEVVVQESNNDISTNVSVKKEVTDVGIINSENKDIVEEDNCVHLENGDISENGEVLAPSAEVEEKEDAENMEKDIVNNDVLENNTLTVADQENDIPQEISQENPGGGTLLLEEPCPSDPVIAEQESTCPSSALPDVENQTIDPSPEDSIPIVENQDNESDEKQDLPERTDKDNEMVADEINVESSEIIVVENEVTPPVEEVSEPPENADTLPVENAVNDEIVSMVTHMVPAAENISEVASPPENSNELESSNIAEETNDQVSKDVNNETDINPEAATETSSEVATTEVGVEAGNDLVTEKVDDVKIDTEIKSEGQEEAQIESVSEQTIHSETEAIVESQEVVEVESSDIVAASDSEDRLKETELDALEKDKDEESTQAVDVSCEVDSPASGTSMVAHTVTDTVGEKPESSNEKDVDIEIVESIEPKLDDSEQTVVPVENTETSTDESVVVKEESSVELLPSQLDANASEIVTEGEGEVIEPETPKGEELDDAAVVCDEEKLVEQSIVDEGEIKPVLEDCNQVIEDSLRGEQLEVEMVAATTEVAVESEKERVIEIEDLRKEELREIREELNKESINSGEELIMDAQSLDVETPKVDVIITEDTTEACGKDASQECSVEASTVNIDADSADPGTKVEHSKDTAMHCSVEKEVIESEDSTIERIKTCEQQIITETKKQTTVSETVEQLTPEELFERFPELRGTTLNETSESNKAGLDEGGKGTFEDPKMVTSSQEQSTVTATPEDDGSTLIQISSSSLTKQTVQASSSTKSDGFEEKINGDVKVPSPPARKKHEKKASEGETSAKESNDTNATVVNVPINVELPTASPEASTPAQGVDTKPLELPGAPAGPPRANPQQAQGICCIIL